MSNKNQYKVQKVHIRNFKNIENLELDLQGKSVFLIGDNSLNKTSIIQAVWVALSNKGIPKKPIKDGAESANIIVVVGADGKEYTIEKSFTEKTEKLEITSPDGFKTQKLENLSKLVGDINFDIMKFVELSNSIPGRREQVKIIRSFLDEETNAKIDSINENIKNIEENRTEINVNIKRLKTNTKGVEFSITDRSKYAEEIDIKELQKEYDDAVKVNNKIDASKREAKYQETEIENLKAQIKSLMKQQIERENKLAAITDELKNAVVIDIEPLSDKIGSCGSHNLLVNKIKAHDKELAILENAEHQYKALAVERDEKNVEKAELIKNSKLPIPGLSFDEDTLYLNGLPLNEEQQSTSELMEIGFKLAVAKDPNVRIVRVDRAESLGAERLKNIMAFAKKNNMQVFYEEVHRGQEELKIEYVEEV